MITEIVQPYLPPFLFSYLLRTIVSRHYGRYKNLIKKSRQLKGIHHNDRCYIIGSGPSLQKIDLKPLKEEIVITLNNLFVHPDYDIFMNGGPPKYHLTAPIHPPQSKEEWIQWLGQMSDKVPKNVKMLFGLMYNKEYGINIHKISEHHGYFRNHDVHYYFEGIHTGVAYQFSNKHIDFTKMIWVAYDSSVTALLFAIYMGFKEINFIGVDHSYVCIKKEQDYRFYSNAVHQENEKEKFSQTLGKSINSILIQETANSFEQYEVIKKHINPKVYNRSPDSLLDIFEYQPYPY